MREEVPMTLGLFFRVCSFLVTQVHYPLHWISEMVDTLLAKKGSLNTNASFPQVSPNEFISSTGKTPTNINLSAFYLELKTQVVLWQTSLPTMTTLSLPSLSSMSKYSMINTHCRIELDRMSCMRTGSPMINCLGMMLQKEKSSDRQEESMHSFFMMGSSKKNILKEVVKGENVHVISSIEWCNIKGKQTLSFWMSSSDMQLYSKYYVSLIRTDSWIQLTDSPMRLKDCF